MVSQCASVKDFLEVTSKGIVIVDFTAPWCNPSQLISPYFESFSKKYKSIKFLKVDVEELPDISEIAGIYAMPAFFVYQDGVVIDELIDANVTKLEELIKRHID